MLTKIVVLVHMVDGDPQFGEGQLKSLEDLLRTHYLDPEIVVVTHPSVTSVAPAATPAIDKFFTATEAMSGERLVELLRDDYTLIRFQIEGVTQEDCEPTYLIRVLSNGEVRVASSYLDGWAIYVHRKDEFITALEKYLADTDDEEMRNAEETLCSTERNKPVPVSFEHMTLLLGWNGKDPLLKK